jgi:hypothetical protein
MLAMAERGSGWAAGLALTLVLAVAQPASAAREYHFDNGIRATVHDARETAGLLETTADGRIHLAHPAADRIELASDEETPCWPLDAAVVAEALRAMTGFRTDVSVDVFLLPTPPLAEQSSFAHRGVIYLAPGTGPVAAETVASITVHEMGHVLTWAFIDGQPGRWESYLSLRGLDADRFGPAAVHADRPREILAEDLRHLFGGALATSSGSIENHDLVLPDQVTGLRELLRGYLRGRVVVTDLARSQAAPNPCNPLTTITMELPDAAVGEAELRIYDVRGRCIRTLRGGDPANGRVALRWEGTDDSGRAAASGRYVYVMTAAGVMARGTVTLVR